jgi:hypothetical protein
MKVTGETFSFILRRKRSRRGKILKVSKLSGKRTVAGQNSGELYKKTPTGQFLFFYEFSIRIFEINLFLIISFLLPVFLLYN